MANAVWLHCAQLLYSLHVMSCHAAAAAGGTTFFTENGRPQWTPRTRLKRQKHGNLSPYARKKPGSPFFLPLGQLPMWFLGRFKTKSFVPLPRVWGLLNVLSLSLNRTKDLRHRLISLTSRNTPREATRRWPSSDRPSIE